MNVFIHYMSCWKQICCWCGHLLAIPWCLSSPPPLNHDVTAFALSWFSKSLTGKRNPSSIIHRDYGLYCTESIRTIQRPLEPRQYVLHHGQPVWLSVDPDVSTGFIKKWALLYKQNIWEWEEMEKIIFFQFSQHTAHTHPNALFLWCSPVSNLEQQVFSFMWFLMQS